MSGPELSILVVDDEEATRSLLSSLLARRGHATLTVSDGAAALHALQTAQFDLIILDIGMRGLTGLDVLRFVTSRALQTDVVMLTGDGDIGTAVDCIKEGACDYLTKPTNAADILSAVARVSHRRKRREDGVSPDKSPDTMHPSSADTAELASTPPLLGTALPLKEIERFRIIGVLASVGGRKKQAAAILGISLKTPCAKLEQCRISLR